MNINEKNASLDELKKVLKETSSLLEYLFNLEADYPSLRDDLSDAEDCIEESFEMKDNDLAEIRDQLVNESNRVEEFRFYFRALRSFCLDSHVVLPTFIMNGFDRLCEKEYRQAAFPPASPSEDNEDALFFKKRPHDSLDDEEALPW